MRDLITEAYLGLFNEAAKVNTYKLYDIVAAVAKATNGFRLSWDKNITSSQVQYALNDIRNGVIQVNAEKVKEILSKVKAQYEADQSGIGPSSQTAPFLLGDGSDKDVPKFNLNYLAFNIWLAMKNVKSKELGLDMKFAAKDKVELKVVVTDIDSSTYKKFGTSTDFLYCECEDYPGIDFRVMFGQNMPADVGIGDVIKIKGSVKAVDYRNTQVSIQRAVVIEKLGHVNHFEGFGESDKPFTKTSLHMSVSPKHLIAKMKEMTGGDEWASDYLQTILSSTAFDGSKDEFMRSFDSIVKQHPEAEQLRAEAEAYYDELQPIKDKIPNTEDWMDLIE